MPTEERADRRTDRHVATRRQIVEAAWVLSREQGLAGWSLRDLAASVGMRAPSLYVYFNSKNALFDALFADGYAALLERFDAAGIAVIGDGAPDVPDVGPGADGRPTDLHPDAHALLVTAARSFVDFCVEDPARFALLFLRTIPGFTPSPESYALARQVLDRTARLLRAVGLDSPEDIDLWTAVVTGLVAQQLSNDPGGDRWTRLVDRAVTGFLAGRYG